MVKVAHLRDVSVGGGVGGTKWTNADYVPKAVEMCTNFRVRIEGDGAGGKEEGTEFDEILSDVLEGVRAPF